MLPAFLLVLVSFPAMAQGPTNPPSVPPPAPVAKSPVDAFRELLGMDPEALRTALSNRTEQTRARLKEKINEYKLMDADERELRLLTTELRWYIPQLMQLPATHRADRLAGIRPDLRPLIDSRLARWDALPEELRQQFIQNEEALGLLLKIGQASDRLQQKLVASVPPEQRDALHRTLARLDAMSPAERKQAFEVFENVFNMTTAEKQKHLRVMSDLEKQQMEKTLATFSLLSPTQRKACVRAYEKFAGMTPVERALFLHNVQTWEKMSPKERQEWREVVKNVEILPPVLEGRPKSPPPPPTVPTPRITTNRT